MASHDKDSLQMGHKYGRSQYRRQDPINIFPLLDDIALFNQEGLLDPGDFVKECQKRGIQVVNEAELEWYERKGLLYPILRIPKVKQWYRLEPNGSLLETDDATPADNKVYRYRAYPVTGYGTAGNVQALRDEGLLIQPNRQLFHPWREFRDPQAYFGDKITIATYYHLYQILHVYWLKQKIIIQKLWRRESEDEWVEDIRILANQLPRRRDFIQELFIQELYDYDVLVALFLAIQNRYRPSAVGILSNYSKRDRKQYTSYVEHFSAQAVLNNVPIFLEALRRWRSVLRREGREIDPLSKWSDLVGHVSGRKRQELCGSALLAQEFYIMAEMASSFLEDLARERGEEEPDPEHEQEQYYQHQRFGRVLNYRDIDVLEQILTDYDLNPRPRVLFVVEGKTEKTVIPILCEAMGLRLETFGVALYDIAGVGKDLSVLARFVAPPRLGAPVQPEIYAAARQTRIFILFDREERWKEGEEKARKVVDDLRNKIKEMLPEDLPNQDKDMIAERGVMIELWERSFEFDNFFDEELAEAISAEAHKYGWPEITPHEVACAAETYEKEE